MSTDLCACGCGASLANLRSDAVYASEACSKRHKRAASADKGPTRKECQAVAEEAILDHFRADDHEPFHSDDLWHVIPDQHRGVISLAVMAMVNKKLIVSTGVLRKSAIPSRKRSPSQEYRLTKRGRDRLAGVSAGVRETGASPRRVVRSASTDPGEGSSAVRTGGAEESRPTPEPLSLLPEPPRLFDHDTPRAA